MTQDQHDPTSQASGSTEATSSATGSGPKATASRPSRRRHTPSRSRQPKEQAQEQNEQQGERTASDQPTAQTTPATEAPVAPAAEVAASAAPVATATAPTTPATSATETSPRAPSARTARWATIGGAAASLRRPISSLCPSPPALSQPRRPVRTFRRRNRCLPWSHCRSMRRSLRISMRSPQQRDRHDAESGAQRPGAEDQAPAAAAPPEEAPALRRYRFDRPRPQANGARVGGDPRRAAQWMAGDTANADDGACHHGRDGPSARRATPTSRKRM